jgi:hypothetical protein
VAQKKDAALAKSDAPSNKKGGAAAASKGASAAPTKGAPASTALAASPKGAAGPATSPKGAASPAAKAPAASALERAGAAQAAAPPGANELFKTLGLRLGLPIAAIWIVLIWVNHWAGYLIGGALTAAAFGFAYWIWRRLQGTRQVANILQMAQGSDKEGRKAALDQLDASFKKDDVAAALARAQLLIQDDPDRALEVLQSVDLSKALPAEADQVRVQRAMLHLVRGEVDRARPLADAVELTRTEDANARAALAAVIGEAWARSGQAKKALTTLEVFNADDEALGDVRWQLWRARAFAHASTNDPKLMRRALKKLAAQNPQFLAGFLGKKVHPLLEREARQMLMQSGAVPRRVQMQRR